MFVRNHMCTEVLPISPALPVCTARERLSHQGLTILPVVDDMGQLLGTFSHSDLCKSVCDFGEAAFELPVLEVMTLDVLTVEPADSLERVLTLFTANDRLEIIPVVDRSKLLGVVRRSDISRVLSRILGFHEAGACVEAAMLEPAPDLPAALKALQASSGRILTVLWGPVRADGSEPILYCRVPLADRDKVEKALTQAGLLLLVPESEVKVRRNGSAPSTAVKKVPQSRNSGNPHWRSNSS